MKFFHLSDLHIGKQLHRYHMAADQRDILDKIVELVKKEKPDAVILAGDIYDSPVPSAEAVSVFDRFLTMLDEQMPLSVLIIAEITTARSGLILRAVFWQSTECTLQGCRL